MEDPTCPPPPPCHLLVQQLSSGALRACGRGWAPAGSPRTLTLQRDPQRDMLGAQGMLSSAGELPFVSHEHPRQLKHFRVAGRRGAQGQAPPGPADPGGGVAVDDADQAQGLALPD